MRKARCKVNLFDGINRPPQLRTAISCDFGELLLVEKPYIADPFKHTRLLSGGWYILNLTNRLHRLALDKRQGSIHLTAVNGLVQQPLERKKIVGGAVVAVYAVHQTLFLGLPNACKAGLV
jgi:hypothetical protein